MQVNARSCPLQYFQQALGIGQLAAIERRGGVEPTLDAELRGSQLLGFRCPRFELGLAEPVGPLVSGIAAKGAEAAVLDAVVGDVEIAVHHIGDRVASNFGAEGIGSQAQLFVIPLRRQAAQKGQAKGGQVMRGITMGSQPVGMGCPNSFEQVGQVRGAPRGCRGRHQQMGGQLPGPWSQPGGQGLGHLKSPII